jgi:hypothetical protein
LRPLAFQQRTLPLMPSGPCAHSTSGSVRSAAQPENALMEIAASALYVRLGSS